jgi:hypothetical protein
MSGVVGSTKKLLNSDWLTEIGRTQLTGAADAETVARSQELLRKNARTR